MSPGLDGRVTEACATPDQKRASENTLARKSRVACMLIAGSIRAACLLVKAAPL